MLSTQSDSDVLGLQMGIAQTEAALTSCGDGAIHAMPKELVEERER